MNEKAIRAYWADFCERNHVKYAGNTPKSLETLYYRLHKHCGRRLTDAEAVDVAAKVAKFDTPNQSMPKVQF